MPTKQVKMTLSHQACAGPYRMHERLHIQTQSILAIALVALLSAVPGTSRLFAAGTVVLDADSVVQYVLSCRKENGAFGPTDQDYTDAAWNFPAVKTLALLGEEIDRPQQVIDNGLGYPPGHVGYGHWQFLHQHGLRKQLGRPIQAKHRMRGNNRRGE